MHSARYLRYLTRPIGLILLAATALPACAAGRVELELVTEPRVPITAQQEWLRSLAQAGVANLRIRTKRPQDKMRIDARGTPAAPVYVVTGVITSNNEVRVPGGRFRFGDAAGLARWLDDLAQHGPADGRPKKTAFGLDAEQFQQVHDDLAQTVGFSTQGVSCSEVIGKIGRKLTLPLSIDPDLLRAMEEVKVTEELSKLSCGTALAYAVRPMGMCLVPRKSEGGPIEYAIVLAKPDTKVWPVGWEPEKPRRDVLPGLFEFLNVNVEGVPVTEVLEAVHTRLKLPVLLDRNAMARHGVEPEKVFVNLPRSRTTYSLLLRRVLFQARLKSELRLDEADTPFLWVTTIKPLGLGLGRD